MEWSSFVSGESFGCCCFCCGEERKAPDSISFSGLSLGQCFPTEQKEGSSDRYLTRTLHLSSLDGFISHHIPAGLPSSVYMAICMMLSSSATTWWHLVIASAGWHYLPWEWAMSTLWCHSSPATLWCGEVLVPLLERLVGLLVDLQKGVSFLWFWRNVVCTLRQLQCKRAACQW